MKNLRFKRPDSRGVRPLLTMMMAIGLVLASVSFDAVADNDQTAVEAERKQQLAMVDWKLLFNRLFALEIYKQEVLPLDHLSEQEKAAAFDHLLKAHTAYTPLTFNQSLNKVLGATTSMEAYETRESVFRQPANRQHIAEFGLNDVIAEELQADPVIKDYLQTMLAHQDRPIADNDLFLASPEGRNMVDALTYQGQQQDAQGVIFVAVPGYVAHTIKDYIFEEFINEVNTYYGRCRNRPVLKEENIDIDFLDHVSFYGSDTQAYCPDENLVNHHQLARGDDQAFVDVFHPAGKEMGNTAGYNAETTRLMRQWLRTLPAKYQDKKIILLGYSKGAPIILDMIRQIKEDASEARRKGEDVDQQDLAIADRIMGFVTFAGVVQGTNVARSANESIEDALKGRTIDAYIDEARKQDGDTLIGYVAPFFSDLDFSFLSNKVMKKLFDLFDFDYEPVRKLLDRVIDGRELREIRDGFVDLSPVERTRWNLRHFNDEVFHQPVFVFNATAITDISVFSRPMGINSDGTKTPSVLHPKLRLNDEGEVEIDFRQFSLDSSFLYLSSIGGFKTAPGGLFDTQMEMANTKAFTLDHRPLSESLTEAEIDTLIATIESEPKLYQSLLSDLVLVDGSVDQQLFRSMPRRELLADGSTGNLDAIDLGEFRGHHWSLFVQAIKPPKDISDDYVYRQFPRQAYMRALFQVMGMYNLVQKQAIESARAQ
ncbi:MAG: hypothetical protein CMP10_18085 [Zetaproteobacteria bacterium]|nr:hypothetical protein [Pseudobdellovibrionaceae bacterium]